MSVRKCDDPRYIERARAQMLAWAGGRSYHEPINDECCPDFSCCVSGMRATDAAERWAAYHKKYGGLA